MTTTVVKAPGEVAPFQNETVKDFKDPGDAAAMKAALDSVRQRLGRHYPLVIDGRKIETEKTIRSLNPADPSQVIGVTSAASKEQAEQAIGAAARAFESWRRLTLPERAQYVFKAAALLRERRFEYDALLVYEVGKSWPEADGDIAEAIDFPRVSTRVRRCVTRSRNRSSRWRANENELVYIPLGVGAVIPPWNFAGAIMMGMTAAAIVCGNTVVLKPSSDAADHRGVVRGPAARESACRRASSTSFPARAAKSATSSSRIRKIRFISFTGSKEVGLRINELAAKPQPGQKWIKRVVAEMGGKDSIVVAADADLDAAVEGVALSAFGFQGQKCSACSRASWTRRSTTSSSRSSRAARRQDHRRRSERSGQRHGPGRQRGRAEVHHRIHRQGAARGAAAHRRQARRANAATSSSRRSSPTSRPTQPSRRRRSSAPCSR